MLQGRCSPRTGRRCRHWRIQCKSTHSCTDTRTPCTCLTYCGCLQSLLLLNVSLNGAAFAVDNTPSTKCPSAGPCQIDAWRQGGAFTAGKPDPSPQGDVDLRHQPWPAGVSRPEVPSATAAEVANALTDGCMADGVHDDIETLQLSIDKRAVVTFLPLGVYATSGSLMLHNGTMLLGENMAALALKPSASGLPTRRSRPRSSRWTAGRPLQCQT